MSNNLWGQIDQEPLVWHTLDEAIAVYVSQIYEEAGLDVCLPEIVTFAEYESMTVSRAVLKPLQRLLEDLDEEYSVFDWVESTKPTDAMKVAEEAFLDAVLSEYKVHGRMKRSLGSKRCHVNVREWQQARSECDCIGGEEECRYVRR